MNKTFFTIGLFSLLFLGKKGKATISSRSNQFNHEFQTKSLRELQSMFRKQNQEIQFLKNQFSELVVKAENLVRPEIIIQPSNTEVNRDELKIIKINDNEIKTNIISGPKIILYGFTRLSKHDMFSVIYDGLMKYKIHIKKSDITFLTSKDKRELKKKTPIEKLKSGDYDYLIVVSPPHSTKGKELKSSWEKFLEKNKIRTKIIKNYNKSINKSMLINFCNEIGEEICAATDMETVFKQAS